MTDTDRGTQRDRDSAFYLFTQQNLPACKPVLTPEWVVEIVERYDIGCVPEPFRINKVSYIQDDSIPKNCSLSFKVCQKQKRQATLTRTEPTWHKFMSTCRELKVNRKNIAWKSDREHKFGKNVYPFNFQNGTLIGGGKLNPRIPLSDQEDLIVWMRTSALPSFRKLYGRIEKDLDVDDVVVVHLMNNYNTYSFGGKKKLVLSTTSWLGGKNDFLGLAYVFIGSSSVTIAVVFTLLHLLSQRH
ncbi:hypothetical protein ERO13_D10G044100v2 [Gossypium hirsutum]|nr:hypothetical protein ERO13_D10G044100v2 [Gossypium hirsutum]